MLLVFAGYRKDTYIHDAIASLRGSAGVTRMVFVDDSGDPDFRASWRYDDIELIPVADGNAGYQTAMQTIKAVTAGEARFALWEEDFQACEPIDFNRMQEILDARPYLAQLALLRGPHFPVEHEHGGVIEARQAAGAEFETVDGVIEHTDHFTCNPSVWNTQAVREPWPTGKWSEDAFGRNLTKQGHKFGYMPGIRTEHVGVRSGHSY